MVGDPGFFGTLGSIFKKAVPVAAGLGLGGPLGALAANALARRRGGRQAPMATTSIFKPPTAVQLRGFLPGGAKPGISFIRDDGTVGRKRRRIDYGNTRALRRAVRRTDGFVRIAKSALKNTGFKIVSKSSGKMTEAAWQKRSHHRK